MKVYVPATTANIGPGFDSLGIALNLYNTYELCDKKSCKASHTLADDAFQKYFTALDKKAPPLCVRIVETTIPISRGLGSSASLIVGGLLLANQYNNHALTDEELLNLATEMEGHPDNVAPALLGGLVISAVKDNKVYIQKISLSETLDFITFIPPYESSTSEARQLLPDLYLKADVIHNISRVALLVSSLMSENYQNVSESLEDKLHEPYREETIPDYAPIKALTQLPDIYGSFISGAGPTMIALAHVTAETKHLLSRQFSHLNVRYLAVNNQGYYWE
ncbi:homoserine kinase [Dolosigranulum pigrum]|uniref:homoserine kinase n=1 Tax=Dolosigranulum pigrum TaxID=29394 RepID=UPI001AD85BEE|nr:homoserine kinase [Dolosigranulum pigrum]QTJ56484.1 homoserine kinase [Dolosigranulum pigrum]